MCFPCRLLANRRECGRHNYARLKTYLIQHAFDPNGNALLHIACLQGAFGFSHCFATDVHHKAVLYSNAKTETVTKRQFTSMNLKEEDAVADQGLVGSFKAFLKKLADTDKLIIKTRVR